MQSSWCQIVMIICVFVLAVLRNHNNDFYFFLKVKPSQQANPGKISRTSPSIGIQYHKKNIVWMTEFILGLKVDQINS